MGHLVTGWWRRGGLWDTVLSRVLRHTGVLFGANVLASIIGLATLALASRGLGMEGLGILVTIVAFVAVIDQFVNFQAWQAVVRFGAEALEKKRDDDFCILVRVGFFVEIVAAIVGTAVALLILVPVARKASWSDSITLLAGGYSLSLLVRVTGTPTAVLRLFNRFDLTAVQTVLAALIKLIGVAIGFARGAGVGAYVLIWAISDVIGRILLIAFALGELKRRGFGAGLRGGMRGVLGRFPDIWGVVWTANASDAIRVVTRDLDLFLVGLLLGPSSTAVYKIAKQVADIPGRFANPLLQVLYPYLARLWSRGDAGAFSVAGKTVAVCMGTIGVVLLLVSVAAGERLLVLAFGPEFGGAYTALCILMLAYCIFYFGIHLRPAALALGMHREVLRTSVFATVLFCIAYFPLIKLFQVNGAAMAHVIFFAAWCGFLGHKLRSKGLRGVEAL
jgi:O-antigen/teichoic acid export membrane protein